MEGIDRNKLLRAKLESRARVWGILIFSVLVWLFIGIVTFNIEGPGFALFAVASVICPFDVFYNAGASGANIRDEDLIIMNDEDAVASGFPDFWNVLNEVASLSGVSGSNVVGVVRHSPKLLGRAFKNPQTKLCGVMVADRLLAVLSRSELAAVIAHEIAHNVEVRDDRLSLRIIKAITATLRWLSGALASSVATLYAGWKLGWWVLPMDLMPLAFIVAVAVAFGLFWGARLYDLVLQEREFMADVYGAEKIGSVLPLIDALTKIVQPMRKDTWKDFIFYKPGQRSHPTLDQRIGKLFSIRKYTMQGIEK